MKKEDAEEFTQSLGQIVGGSYRQIMLAKRLGVPKALDLSVDEWVNKRLGGYVRMNVDDRRKAVAELAAEGESNRSIASTLGVDEGTVRGDRAAENSAQDDVVSKREEVDPAENSAPLDLMSTMAADDKVRAQAAIDENRRRHEQENAETAAAVVPPPSGKYRCIVIDPPWPTQKFEREVRPNQSKELDYPTMTMEEIENLGVAEFAADDGCHLFCWTTQKHLPATIDIVAGWGFSYVLTMVWHKPGGPQPWGLPQYNCEFCIYARQGKADFIDTKAFFACFSAPRREHSRKPDEFYEVIRRVCEGPRYDWFAREQRDGFTAHGNETERFVA